MKKYVITAICLLVIAVTSCDFTPLSLLRKWNGSSTITLDNGGAVSYYTGTVLEFALYSDESCLLEITDSFLTGTESSTTKSYSGWYAYDEDSRILDASLTLSAIDEMSVSPAMAYTMSISDGFDIESHSGTLEGDISDGDMEGVPGLSVTITLDLNKVE
ncbi:MAG: hypothetical protein JW881_11750 [Spirochaetales bacterium]|nr:hypothetical protein [Spirochaetales bacterium]